MPAAAFTLIVLAYLFGTVPTAQIVAQRWGVDPTSAGSGNPGASNVTRLAGRWAGAGVLVGDVGKGVLATLLAMLVGGRPLAMACGLAVILGHIVPLTRWFHGGRGVATAAGVALVMWPTAGAVLVVVWALTLAVAHRASVASLVGAATLPFLVWLTTGELLDVVVAAIVATLVVLRHRDNLRRLRHGEEPMLRGR